MQMKRMMIVAAMFLVGASVSAVAAEKGGASQMSPGHEMQTGPGTTKGASEDSPGDRMQDKGTVGSSKGASEYSPGDRMNDRRKK
jgi:hypothetical protein